jgi:hypothetical protein
MLRRLVLLTFILLAYAVSALSQPGYYRVTTQPGGVKIFINEVPADSAGMLNPGTYSLRVEKEGYHSQIRQIEIQSDRIAELRVRLLPARIRARTHNRRYDFKLRQTSGSLILSSNPPGLAVSLNNDGKGTTPLRIDGVPTGSHVVTIGGVSDTVLLRTQDLLRLRLEAGKIQNVTKEIYQSNYEHVRLRNFALFMEEDETRARDCASFRNRRGSSFFRLASAGMYLITRMIFRNAGDSAISVPVRFSIYRGSSLFSRARHTIRLDPNVDHDWCYYHFDYWDTGEYTLAIEGTDGHRWGEIYFRIYRE